jgi:hypothetical protein
MSAPITETEIYALRILQDCTRMKHVEDKKILKHYVLRNYYKFLKCCECEDDSVKAITKVILNSI